MLNTAQPNTQPLQASPGRKHPGAAGQDVTTQAVHDQHHTLASSSAGPLLLHSVSKRGHILLTSQRNHADLAHIFGLGFCCCCGGCIAAPCTCWCCVVLQHVQPHATLLWMFVKSIHLAAGNQLTDHQLLPLHVSDTVPQRSPAAGTPAPAAARKSARRQLFNMCDCIDCYESKPFAYLNIRHQTLLPILYAMAVKERVA